MKQDIFDQSVFEVINERAEELENELNADVIYYYGPIIPPIFQNFRDNLEELKSKMTGKDAIAVLLTTGGGSAETTERMVNALRHHYKYLYFVVPDVALSAGTIFCMSGDKIYMDYSSSLGPIDPQIPAPDNHDYVPALGYLDKVNEIISKGNLSQADVVLLKSIDLARLAMIEQAKQLSVDLLKGWLVEYKFKDWNHHRTTNPGTAVTKEEKEIRAQEIAEALSNHTLWRSHGRNLDIAKLEQLRIEIDDYSMQIDLRGKIRGYNDLLTGFVERNNIPVYFHNWRLN